jgi:hypothetical protein
MAFLHTHCVGQSNDSLESTIKKIRAEYNEINKNATLKYKQENLEGQSAGGGVIKKYYDKTILRKAVIIFYGETGKSTIEYYFKNKRLIFSYEKEDRYEAPLFEKNDGKIKTTNINRYYFRDGKLIRWIGSNGKIVDSKFYQKKEEEVREDLKNYMMLKPA